MKKIPSTTKMQGLSPKVLHKKLLKICPARGFKKMKNDSNGRLELQKEINEKKRQA